MKVKVPTPERQVQVGVPTLVVVQVPMTQARAIRAQKFVSRVSLHLQVGVPDVEV